MDQRLARAESKQEVGQWERSAQVMRHKWQSSGALSGHHEQVNCASGSNFGRLKKSYASMRKSFRVQAEAPARRKLISQIGDGAARLLRGVYAAKSSHLEQDCMQATDGSFKVLSPASTCYVEPASSAASKTETEREREIAPVEVTATTMRRKSELELEIEQRLRRSKRRVLPSASYKAPDSKRVCDELNIDHLEEIKRDNLRVTLRLNKSLTTGEQADEYCSCSSIMTDARQNNKDKQEEEEEEEEERSRLLSGFEGEKEEKIEDKLQIMFDSMGSLSFNERRFDEKNCCGQAQNKNSNELEVLSRESGEPRAKVVAKREKGELLSVVNGKSLGGATTFARNNNTVAGSLLAKASNRQFAVSAQPTADAIELDPNQFARSSGRDQIKAEQLVVRISNQSKKEEEKEEEADNDEPAEVTESVERRRSRRRREIMLSLRDPNQSCYYADLYAPNEHLYASIYSANSPSPEQQEQSKQQLYYNRPNCWQKVHYERSLFDKQLHNETTSGQHQHQMYQHQQPKKRSLLGRLKKLIAPTCKRDSEASQTRPQPRTQRRRWQKSATLSSKSSQNLMSYLSSSRKSINLAGLERAEEAAVGRRSLINGFLTIGSRQRSGRHVSDLFGDNKRAFGSVDSLPSADSGLSCGNLQLNSSSSDNDNNNNNNGNGNLYSTSLIRGRKEEDARPVVGRARALVDCNPCAYDREALVFKRGDLIEILERRQCGTWIGRCNQQVGHFKFINVLELADGVAKEAPFVTKLEIRSSSRSPLNAASKRRSKSMNVVSNEREATGKLDLVSRGNQLSDSNETIMSSLEQLLFAIGLAGEESNCLSELGRGELNETTSGRSYLEVLNSGGIKNLDSFSNIDHWHELQQMGIVNDEHQRRLLMAAKIIRQASRAAKLDFVQSQAAKSESSTESEFNCATSSCSNEPIYVNVPARRSIGRQVDGSRREIHDFKSNANLDQLDRDGDDNWVQSEQQNNIKNVQTTREFSINLSAIEARPKVRADEGRISSKRQAANSISQPDHYHIRRLSTQKPSMDTLQVDRSVEGGQQYSNVNLSESDHDDDGADHCNRLAGGYSAVRVSKTKATSQARRFNQINDLGGQRKQQINHNNNLKSSANQNSDFDSNSVSVSELELDSNSDSDFDLEEPNEQYQWHQSKPTPSSTNNNNNNRQLQDANSRRSHMMINSNSAYDLRLDLSHFFS